MEKKTLAVGSLLLLLISPIMADELEIKLVDESAKSELFQKDTSNIVGCSDNTLKKEMSCAKKPQEAVLSKLPSSQQLEEKDLEDNTKKENIKEQLQDILTELTALKLKQQADSETIKELKIVIEKLKDKKLKKSPKKMANIKTSIQKMRPKSKNYTRIKRPIKEISRTDDAVIIQVQNNESLSTYAQYYYNNNRLYYKIYKANREIIPPSLQLIVGQRIKIPLN